MVKLIKTIIVVLFVTVGLCSCSDDSNEDKVVSDNTILVYMPWTGNDSNLLSCFKTNISDMKESVTDDGIRSGNRILIFLSESSTSARLFELKKEKGKCIEKELKQYSNPAGTATGIAGILADVEKESPSLHYSMIIGGHGLGWINSDTYNGKASASVKRIMPMKSQDLPFTRFFGSVSGGFQTDLSTLADGIKLSGLDMRFILFDACNMANVETVYELKDVTDYVIACPTEIMGYGMPYKQILPYLWGTPDYKSVCSEMIDYYKKYTYRGYDYPYATISVVDCSQLEALAYRMRLVNASMSDKTDVDGVQILDGYYPHLFFDLADYISHFCQDKDLAAAFLAQLSLAVPYKGNTEYFYTELSSPHVIKLDSYCGITVSDPSKNSYASDKQSTSWWKATH